MEKALDAVDNGEKRPMDMRIGDWSVKEAAALMGVSEKTIRRHVKDNVLPSRRQPGKFGEELRVTAIPESDIKAAVQTAQAGPRAEAPSGAASGSSGVAASAGAAAAELDVKTLLEQRDRQLAELNQMLGAARLRISQLEAQVNLLEMHTSRAPWWRRAWSRLTGRKNAS